MPVPTSNAATEAPNSTDTTSPSPGTLTTASPSPNTPPASSGSQGPSPGTSSTGTSNTGPTGGMDSAQQCSLACAQEGSRLSANNGGTGFCGTNVDLGGLEASDSCGGGSRRRWAAAKRQGSPVNIILAVAKTEAATKDLDGNIEQPPTLPPTSSSVSETGSSSQSTSGSGVVASSTPSITGSTQMTPSTSSASSTSSDDDDDCEATDSSSSEGPSMTESTSSATEGPGGPSGTGPRSGLRVGQKALSSLPSWAARTLTTRSGTSPRDRPAGTFIGGAGPINPESCADATKFELVDWELLSGDQAVRVDPGLSFTEFKISPTGSIYKIFGVAAGTLVWANDAFSGGQAGFCQVPSG
ncbi:hypothetical protein DL766_004157 [Monosporascus sp. MC13-8B]|uniref:DUF7908 domain-containing protein n=1 Tax=Monosporascus cannonballus TaxID=155416 RepID=A0ABY0H782_9PEZI|nr:hypothetical protein DL763_010221 [Monosporascus cannonballus]RYO83202.1 hypothetical protein DL762_006247 [Monosporascus cannonballus]RYP31970.1 hypothetical protein DL766_004157 [Monosporascus sp. MC13-8B]